MEADQTITVTCQDWHIQVRQIGDRVHGQRYGNRVNCYTDKQQRFDDTQGQQSSGKTGPEAPVQCGQKRREEEKIKQ